MSKLDRCPTALVALLVNEVNITFRPVFYVT